MNDASTHILSRLAPAAARVAAQQYVAAQLTGRPPITPTPGYEDLAASHEDSRRLPAIVEALAPNQPTVPWYARAALHEILEPGFDLIRRQYPTPAHRAFVRRLPAKDYLDHRLVMGVDGLTVTEVGELAEFPKLTHLDLTTATARPKTYGMIAPITRPELTNDRDLGLLRGIGEAMVAAAYRAEAEAVFGVLESNPTLADGAPLFGEGNSATGPSEVTALANGIEKFHAQQFANGQFVGAQPAFLVCPPNWSVLLSDTLVDLALTRPTVTVLKSPHISSAYLLADPARTPTIGLLTLTDAPSLSTAKGKMNTDVAMQMKVEHVFRAVALSRYGIVKISKT